MGEFLRSSSENFSYLLEMTEDEKDLNVLGHHRLTIKWQLYGFKEKTIRYTQFTFSVKARGLEKH